MPRGSLTRLEDPKRSHPRAAKGDELGVSIERATSEVRRGTHKAILGPSTSKSDTSLVLDPWEFSLRRDALRNKGERTSDRRNNELRSSLTHLG